MTIRSAHPEALPLQRFLKRHGATELLATFDVLLPNGKLALIGTDHRVYAGSMEWNLEELEELYAQVSGGQTVKHRDTMLLPIFLQSRYIGALIACTRDSPGDEQMLEGILRCLHASVTQLLGQALETRDVIQETLARYREINLLYRIGKTMGSCLEADEIPNLILHEVRNIIEAEIGIVMLSGAADIAEGEIPKRIAASFGRDADVRKLQEGCSKIIDRVFETGLSTIVDSTSVPQTTFAGKGSILCVPLKAPERMIGVLLLGRKTGQPEFTAGDGKLALALAHQAAISIETARLHIEDVARQRLNEELAIGHNIQLSLLPQSCPSIDDWEFSAAYRPAWHVGGDLYDFISLNDEHNQWGIVIADVTGKGIPAALFMACSRTILRNESMNDCNPAEILKRANRSILQDIRYRLFLSVLYATLDTRSGRLVYANGGHDWPLWYRADHGEIQWLAASGLVLGAFHEVELKEVAIQIMPGDALVFYTDGITEARDDSGNIFGEERLSAVVHTHAGGSAQELLDVILAEVERFSQGVLLFDDITLVVLKRQL